MKKAIKILEFVIIIIIIIIIIGSVCPKVSTQAVFATPSDDIEGWRFLGVDLSGSYHYPYASKVSTSNILKEKFSIEGTGGNVLTGDVAGDGHLELIYVAGNQLKIFDGIGNLLRNVTLGSSSCRVTMIEDINGDDILDIGIGTGGTSDLKTYFYDGEGNLLKTFSKTAGYDCSMKPAGLLGNGDFVVSFNAGYSHSDKYRGFAVYDKDTDSEKWYYKVGPAFDITSIADFDGDGMLEFTNYAGTVHNGCNADGYNNNGTMTTDGDIWLIVVDQQGNEKFSWKYSSPSDGSSRHYFVDLNHDGSMEILGFEGHDPTYYHGTAEIHLFDQKGEVMYTFAGANNAQWSFTIADIDSDGKDEVIASDYPVGSTLYVLDENLVLQDSTQVAGKVQLSCDLNGDGNNEIVLLDDEGNLKVLNMNLEVLDTYNIESNGKVVASDTDRNGIVELIALTGDGIHVLENKKITGSGKKIALINPDKYRILKFGFGNWTGENNDPPCEGPYYSAAYGTIEDNTNGFTNSNEWSGVGQQPDFIAEVLRNNGYSVDEYSAASFPASTLDDYDVVIVQDPMTENIREFSRSVESDLPDLLENVVDETFVNKLKNYFNSGGKLILVGDAVRLLEASSDQKNTLNFGKTVLTDQVANSSSHDCAPDIWPFIRGNPFCCVDRSGTYSYEVSSTTLSLDGTIISNLILFNGLDLGPAQIWSDTVYYPADGTSLLDIKVSGSGEFVTRGNVCSPPIYSASINDVLSNFMGYTTYNDNKIYYIGSDSFWDYQVRNNHGAWHCSGDDWAEIKNQITETGKEAIVKLVQLAINENYSPVTPVYINPSDGASDIDGNISLSWNGGDPDAGDTVTYDIYFGSSNPPPLVSSDHSYTTYESSTLSYNTTYYWKIVSKDNHGATTEGPVWSFTTSNYPVAVLSSLPPNITNQADINIAVAGEDVVAYKYNLDDSGWSSEIAVSTTIDESVLSDGNHTIKVIGKYSNGILQPVDSATTFNWNVDTGNPQITTFTVKDTSTQSDQITNNRDVDIAITGIDNSGSFIKWLITETDDAPTVEQMNAGSSTAPIGYTIQSVGDGSKTLYGWAMDAATNISLSAQATITLDTSTTVTIDGGNQCTSNNSIILTGTREDGITVSVDCASATVGTVSYPAAATWQVEVTQLGAGNNVITASITDNAGNQDSDQVTIRHSVPVTTTIDNSGGTLLADGSGTLQISIMVKDGQNQAVCDGTPVEITTTLGEITPATYNTVNGQVICEFKASSDLGTADIAVKYGQTTLATSQVELVPGPIAKLAFTSAEQNIDVGISSSFIQVQTQDEAGHPVEVQTNIGILLTSTSGNTAEFYTCDAGFNCGWNQGDTIAPLASGNHTALFKYKDSSEGQWTITAAEFPEQTWQDGSQNINIGGGIIATIQGAPAGSTDSDSAVITVGGTDVTNYKYKMDTNDWSDEISVSVPISLSGFSEATHTLYVVGKGSDGTWQSAGSATTATWTVNLTTQIPDDPSGLVVDEVGDGKVVLKWNAITNLSGVTYKVYRSETENGIFYQVNTYDIDDSSVAFGYVYFTDSNLKNKTTYFYKVRSFSGDIGSNNFSTVISASPQSDYNYQVNIIESGLIKNIYGSVKYYIQIFPKEDFGGSLLVNCIGLPDGISHKFEINGEEMGTSLSNVIPPASIVLKLTAGSTTPIGEHHFTLRTTNTETGTMLDSSLVLTVVPNNGYGIHVEVEKMLIHKGEPVKVYGSIYPPIPEKTITLTISKEDDASFPKIKTVQTDDHGKFEDDEWIITLGIGVYTLNASWMDDNTNTHVSISRDFIIEKGASSISCTRPSGVTPETGLDFTISGAIDPALTYPFTQLRIIDPDGIENYITASQDTQGEYDITQNFFNKNGIWKFKAYWTGNDDYIGCESDFLVVPVGVDFGRAIILGGGEADQTNTYWGVTKKLAVDTYRDFKSKGFDDDMIYFMNNSKSVDINFDDIPDPVVDDDIPSAVSFTGIIENYFANDLNSDTPLFIYMQGHGTSDGRFKVLGTDQFVSAVDIKNALDELQNQTDCKIILIIEACYSGNFINELSGSNRIIITSAGNEPYNTDSSGRISFSRYLFNKLKQGDNLKKAFDWSRNKMVNMGYPSPQLDDDGNHIADSNDGLIASNTYLNGMLTWGLKPEIQEITVTPILIGGISMPISVKVIQGDHPIDKAWAQIIPPDADITGGDTTITYPEVELSYNTGPQNYEGVLTGLIQAGLYKIIVLAEDTEHEVSDPEMAYISVLSAATPGDVNGNGSVDLADAILSLKIVCNMDTGSGIVTIGGDVNGDNHIGLEEFVYIMQKIAE